MTQPSQRASHRPVARLAAGLVLFAAGCNSLKLFPATDRNDTIAPPSPALATGQPTPPSPPGRYSLRVAPYVFYSDFEVKKDAPVFRELAELRDQVVRELQLPDPAMTIQVFLFEDRDRYEKFMASRYPDLPRRRAFFVAQPMTAGGPDDLYVYTFWGEHIRQDLRHELTHALMHSVLKDVPLWLDEGLAEFFELPPEANGVNRAHLEQMRKIGTVIDLGRLERVTEVRQMTPTEYREAWAWAHWMLRGRPEAREALLSYLRQLRTTATPGPLQPRLAAVFESPNDALAEHLARLP